MTDPGAGPAAEPASVDGDAKVAAWRSPSTWTSSTYFAEGFPYSIVVNVAPVMLAEAKASLGAIGLINSLHLAWNLKFLVGPLVDEFASKRRWLIAIEVVLAATLFALSFVASLPELLSASVALFALLAVASAVHDIAIDGLYLEALSKKDQTDFIGLRVSAYRLAMLAVTGPLLAVCSGAGWTAGFLTMAVMMTALLVFHVAALPRTEVDKRPFAALARALLRPRMFIGAVVLALCGYGLRALWAAAAPLRASLATSVPKLAERLDALKASDWIGLGFLVSLVVALAALPRLRRAIERSNSDYGAAFVSFLAQPYVGRILAFVVLFRVGESFLQTMRYPFLKGELHITLGGYTIIYGTIGMLLGMIAPMVGSGLIAKLGLHRCLWPFMLLQNGLHLLFAVLAVFSTEIAAMTHPPILPIIAGGRVVAMLDPRVLIVAGAVLVEVVGAGLGTAAFMAYLLRCVRPEHKAAHMAILTALMSLSFTLAGVTSGFLADAIGWVPYWAFTFVVTLPGMALAWFVPHVREPGAPPRVAATQG